MSKVLIISPLPPPVGGIASWTVNILNYISDNSIKNIFHFNSAAKFRRITQVSIFERFFFGIFDSLYLVIRFFFKLLSLRPHLVHVTSSGSFGLIRDFLVLLMCKFFGAKTILHFRFGRIPDLEIKKNWEWYFIKVVIIFSDAVLVLDKRTFTCICNHFKNEKLFILPNPCSYSLEKEAKQAICLDKSNSILFVGHIVESKGIYDLVTALSLKPEPLHLNLIGPYEEVVKEKIFLILKELNSKLVVSFLGVLERDVVLSFMRSARFLALPSYTEGFPNVLLEGMSVGCPILASNVGAIPEMLDFPGKFCSGICHEPGNIEEIKIGIEFMLQNLNETILMGQRGKDKLLSEFSMSLIFSKYQIIWNKVLN
jgi:glycosyltransferase involved in cell wall biosynthesis